MLLRAKAERNPESPEASILLAKAKELESVYGKAQPVFKVKVSTPDAAYVWVGKPSDTPYQAAYDDLTEYLYPGDDIWDEPEWVYDLYVQKPRDNE